MIDKVIKEINYSSNILLLTHENPDGDALGSSLAMQLALKKIGKKVNSYCTSNIPSIFTFLPEINSFGKKFLLGDYDLIVILDCGDSKRTGFCDRLKEFSQYKKKIINIDHHPKNDLHRIAKINIVDYNASSASEIVYDIIKKLKIKIDKDIALCLLCGLYTDTGSFKHSNTTPKTFQIASELLRCGARFKKITKNIINNHSLSSLKLWGIALSRLKINQKYKIASSIITKNDIRNCNAKEEDVSGIVNMINTIPDTNIALFIYELDNFTIKASLRTEAKNINLTKIANIFGGGGLKKASGFKLKGKIIEKNDNLSIQIG